MAKLEKYFDKKEPEILLQGFVPEALLIKARAIMKKKGHKIKDLLIASLKQYVDEFESK